MQAAAARAASPGRDRPKGQYFMMGDNRQPVVRLALVGAGAAREPDRARCSRRTGPRTASPSASGHADHPPDPRRLRSRPSRPERRAEPDRPARPAALADRDRLGADDRRRVLDRARDQGWVVEPLPDPVLVDGADAALRPARPGLPGAASPTGCSRTGSSTASATRTGARSSLQRAAAGGGGAAAPAATFVKRLIGLPGDKRRRRGSG